MKLSKGQLKHYWAFQEFCNSKQFYDEYIYVPSTGDHCCVFYTGEEVIVSIDATDTKAEWRSNFNFNPTIRGFHNGFYHTAKIIYNELKPHIQEVRKLRELIPITIIGHSRGGGLAPILDLFLREAGFGHIRTVTFAAPRCATLKGCRTLKKAGLEVHRVEARRDIVDNLPPKFTLFPFRIWKHFETSHYDLPTVQGIDHAEILKALEEL